MFTDKEKEIIEWGLTNGKSTQDVKAALAKYRQATGYVKPQQEIPQDTVGSRVSNVINTQGGKVADAIAGDGQYAGESSIRRGVEATSEAFKAIPGVAMAAAPQPVRSALGWAGGKLGGAMNWLTDKISDSPALQKWTVEHPEDAKALEEVAGTAKAGGEIAGTILLTDQATKGLQAGVDASGRAVKAGVDKAVHVTQPLVSKTKAYVESKGGVLEAGKELVNPTKDAKGALGEVLQGKPKDIPKGMEAFKAIDTDGVKTYADLKVRIDDSIGNLSRQVDDVLLKDTTKSQLDDLITIHDTAGGSTATTNYVRTALDQLDELYKKTGDVKSAKEIQEILYRAQNEGLTKFDVNNIARTYNTEFGQKAFSKTGDPLTSVNAQMYENVRKGVKEVARKGMGGSEAQALDKTISSLYKTQELVGKNVEAVAKLQNKIAEMGILAKAGHAVTKYADILSGGSIRGLIGGLLPRGAGYKVMNALDLEERLRKNLDIINKAIKASSESEVMAAVKALDSTVK